MKTLGVLSVVASLLVAGCADRNDTASVSTPAAAPETEQPVCSVFGGFEERVCPVSLYALIASPTTYDGRTIAFTGYVHKHPDGTIAVYPSREAAAFMDPASSVLCASAKKSCDAYAGMYAEVFGVFTRGSMTDTFFRPVGTLELAHVRSSQAIEQH